MVRFFRGLIYTFYLIVEADWRERGREARKVQKLEFKPWDAAVMWPEGQHTHK